MSWPGLACIAAAGVYGLGAVLQSVGVQRTPGSGVHALTTTFRQPHYLAGLACDLVGWLLTMYALSHLPLFVVHTTLAGSVAVTVVLGWLFLHIPLRRVDGAAIAAVLVGLVLVGLTAGSTLGAGGGSPARVVLVLGVPFVGVVGVVAVRSQRPIIAAMTAGLLFGLGAAAVRTLELGHTPAELLAQPTAWTVPVYLAAGLVVHARSLQHGEVGPVTAALWATEIVVAVVAGYSLFGDRVRPGTLLLAISGILLALGATIQLALSPSHAAAT